MGRKEISQALPGKMPEMWIISYLEKENMIHEHKEISIPLPGQGFINFRFNLKEKDEVMVSVDDVDKEMQPITFNELRDFIDNLNVVTKELESRWVSLSGNKPPAIINDYRSA